MKALKFLKLTIIVSIFGQYSMAQSYIDGDHFLGTWKGTLSKINVKKKTKVVEHIILRIRSQDGRLVSLTQISEYNDPSKRKVSNINIMGQASGPMMSLDLVSPEECEMERMKYFIFKDNLGKQATMTGESANPADDCTNFYFSLTQIDKDTTSNVDNIIKSLPSAESVISTPLLFKNTKSHLSTIDQQNIFDQTGFKISKDKKMFMVDYSDQPFDFDTYIMDLNNDGIDEVFIGYGDNKTSGNTGRSMMFFVKTEINGAYKKQMDISTQAPNLIPLSGKYPTIAVVGPGTVYTSVWAWSKTDNLYEDRGLIEFKTINKYKTVGLEELYTLRKVKGNSGITIRLKILAASNTSTSIRLIEDKKTPIPKVYAKVGSGSKFIGKFWTVGDYDHPFTVSKAGSYYYIKRQGSKGTGIPPALTYNLKTDQLEGWLSDRGVKLKMLVKYDYTDNGLTITPENTTFGGPMYLKRLN